MRLWDQTLNGLPQSLVFKNHCMVVFSCYVVALLLLALVFILLVEGPHPPSGCHSISQPDYSGTYPLVHLYFKRQFHSEDTKFHPRKLFTLSLYLLPLLKGHFLPGKRDTSSGSQKPGLTSIQGTP